jgi:hypothetical protein
MEPLFHKERSESSMPLIHQNQLDRIDSSKINGIGGNNSISQRFEIYSDVQHVFNLTVVDPSVRIGKSEMIVNGIVYQEKTEEYPYGDFIRDGLRYTWISTEAEGGFDIVDDFVVIVKAYFYNSNDNTTIVNAKTVQFDNLQVLRKATYGDYDIDPLNYFEVYDMSEFDLTGFLGVIINGAFYSSPSFVMNDLTDKELVISQLRLQPSDEVTVVLNAM